MTWNIDELHDDALRLLCVDGLGGVTLKELSTNAGGINEAGRAVESGDARTWLPKDACKMLRERMGRIEVDAIRWSADSIQAKIVLAMDGDFPQLLSPLPACPFALWYRGTLDSIRLASVAIVGSRRCSTYGIDQATKFAEAIAKADLSVISGGARGIDGAAHRSALRVGGQTAVILG